MDPENEKIYRSQDRDDKSRKYRRVTKSGRMSKTPKTLMTTSSDEAPRKRPSKTSVSVKQELARLQTIANAIKSKHDTKKNLSKIMVQANPSKVASNNGAVAPIDNSTILPRMNASEMAKQAGMKVVLPVHNLDSNVGAVVQPNESRTRKIGNKSAPAANVTATSTHISQKTNVTSTFDNPASASRNRDLELQDTGDSIIIPEHTTDNVQQILDLAQSTLDPGNLVVTPVDNSNFLPLLSASEMAEQTGMEVVLPVHNFDPNADAVAQPIKSRTGKTIGDKSAPAANVTATSAHVSTKANVISRFDNAVSTSKNRDFDLEEKSDNSRINPDPTTDNLQNIFQTLQSIQQQNNTIMQNQTEMKKQIDVIQEHLAERNLGEAQLTETLYQPLKGFPLSTIEQFKEMESVEQKNTRKKLYGHLLKLGGTKPRDFLHCALKEVMTDKLVCEFSWRGDKTTEKFGNTRISNMLFNTRRVIFTVAAKSCPLFTGPETKAEYKMEFKEILRCTKQRYRNQMKKFKVPETEDADDEYDTIMEEINELEQLQQENSSDADSEAEDFPDEIYESDEIGE